MQTVPALLCLSAAAMFCLSACVSPGTATSKQTATDVPAQLRPAPGEVLILQARGVGVQIYDCSPKAGQPGAYGWTFRAPDAQLMDASGRVLGRHFTGPTWELDEGSSVVGELKASAPSPNPSAIPWLLLAARATAGSGKLTATTSIQRLQTVGGVAPSVGCNAANAGKVAKVPYTADYYFYRAAP
jgi:Protein of unknown function (DUF3455)